MPADRELTDKEKADGYYKKGPWKTFTNWACATCGFDCLDENQMVYHVTMRHGPKAEDLPTLFDGSGNLIVR